MSSTAASPFGPVDLAVIGFVGNEFNGKIIPAIRDLIDREIVRIIDVAFVSKDDDGEITWAEIADADLAGQFAGLDQDRVDLLNDEDLEDIADALEPNTSAAVLVWENVWARRVVDAIAGSGGMLVAFERIPATDVAAAYAAAE